MVPRTWAYSAAETDQRASAEMETSRTTSTGSARRGRTVTRPTRSAHTHVSASGFSQSRPVFRWRRVEAINGEIKPPPRSSERDSRLRRLIPAGIRFMDGYCDQRAFSRRRGRRTRQLPAAGIEVPARRRDDFRASSMRTRHDGRTGAVAPAPPPVVYGPAASRRFGHFLRGT